MFELYTESARRVIFFGRYEASQFGSTAIETEHLLLGLIREDKNLIQRFLVNPPSIESIRKKIEGQTTIHEKLSTSIDAPLSSQCKRILAYAAEEANALNHRHIGTEHLLLGILREESGTAATVLRELGLELESARQAISQNPDHPFRKVPLPAAGVVPDAETAKTIAQVVWDRRIRPAEDSKATDAVLQHGVWLVTGSHAGEGKTVSLGAFIQQADGKILRIHIEDAT
jgi:ATP-dependent Clp protease ATP-binding subunit ClpC